MKVHQEEEERAKREAESRLRAAAEERRAKREREKKKQASNIPKPPPPPDVPVLDPVTLDDEFKPIVLDTGMATVKVWLLPYYRIAGNFCRGKFFTFFAFCGKGRKFNRRNFLLFKTFSLSHAE